MVLIMVGVFFWFLSGIYDLSPKRIGTTNFPDHKYNLILRVKYQFIILYQSIIIKKKLFFLCSVVIKCFFYHHHVLVILLLNTIFLYTY